MNRKPVTLTRAQTRAIYAQLEEPSEPPAWWRIIWGPRSSGEESRLTLVLVFASLALGVALASIYQAG